MNKVSDVINVLVLHWGQSGAGPRLTHELARALHAREDTSVSISYRRDTEFEERFRQLSMPALAVKTYRGKIGALLNIPRFVGNAFRLRRFLTAQRTTVVVSPMFSLWQNLALPLVIGRRVRFVATIHDATEHPGDEHGIKRLCQALDLKYATRIVTFSEHVKENLIRSVPDVPPIDVTVLGSLGGDREVRARMAPRDRTVVVGFFGRLLPYKGLELFVDSIDRLADAGHRVRGEIWGSGNNDYLQTLRPSSHVRLHTGWVDESATNAVVASFDILALPYLEASQSGVLAIAMSEGVPVVATPVAGLVEQVESAQCGVLAAEVSAGAFADVILTLVSDRSAYESLSAKGIEASRGSFSWVRVATDYRESFRRALL